jgi:hypothetical protein
MRKVEFQALKSHGRVTGPGERQQELWPTIRRAKSGSDEYRAVTQSRLIAWAVAFLAFVMAIALVVLVFHYGHNVPFYDDWMIVAALTGHQPITLQWLWAQHNDHRMPLTNLLLLGLFRISGGDFRAGMFFNAAALILMTVLMLGAAFRLRGKAAVTDAFIPLLLLSWRHYGNVLWNWQVSFIAPTLLAVVAVYLVVVSSVPGRSKALGMAVLVCALSLMGAVGPVFATPICVWMLLAAWALARQYPDVARLLGLGSMMGFCLIGLNFVGYHPSFIERPANLRGWLRSSLEVLSVGIDPVEDPGSENMADLWVRELWGSAACTILLLGVSVNIIAAIRDRNEFVRRSGMALLIASALAIAAVIGWSRRDGYWIRYAVLSVPGLLAVYVSTLLRPAGRLGQLLRGVLFICILGTAWPSFMAGWHGAQKRHELLAGFEKDLRAGVPPTVLAEHYTKRLHRREFESEMADNMRMLRSAGVGGFRRLPDDPASETIDVPAVPKTVYRLKNPAYVYIIRLTYQCLSGSPGSGMAPCRVTWSNAADSIDAQPGRYDCGLHKDGREEHVLVWVNEPINQFQIWPDDRNRKWRINVQLLVRP